MHIGFLLPEYPHPKITTNCGGIGTATNNIVLGLLKNHKVSVFVYGQDKTEIIKEENLVLYKIASNSYKYFGWYLYRKQLSKFINYTIKREKIDILEAADWTGITAFMQFKIPLILRLHGSDAYFCYLDKRKQKKKNYFFEKKAYKNADGIISVSRYALQITEQLFNVKKKTTVIPNGLLLDEFQADDSIRIERNTILYFGTIARKKGVLELPYIFNELIKINPSAKLIVVGRDVLDNVAQTSTLELLKQKLSKKSKEGFIYKGIVPYQEIKEIIVKANVCVFPSLSESFGMVTIEAMALKKGIVNTNYPWAKEILIDGEMGFLEDPKDHKAFAIKINTLLEDKNLINKFAFKARQHVESYFSMETLLQENINFYSKIINA